MDRIRCAGWILTVMFLVSTARVFGEEPTVRVGILVGVDQVSVSAGAGFSLHYKNEDQKLIEFPAESLLVFEATEDSVVMVSSGDRELGYYSRTLEIRPKSGSNLILKGQAYAGIFEIFLDQGKLTCVNALKMEKYLKGVVPNEIGNVSKDIIEAAKAQAIAARTYAVKNIGRRKALGFDFYASVNDQVYKGVSSETSLTNDAVDDTRGRILTFAGKPIDAFYHSTCGGRTAGVDEVWSGEPLAYLQVSSDNFGSGDFCSESPRYRWETTWSGNQLEEILKKNIASVLEVDTAGLWEEALYNLAVISRGPSGRVGKVKIGFETREFTITGEQFRRAVRTEDRILNSSLFRFNLNRRDDLTIDSVFVKGAGFGHGLGMCQWGARTMAGQDYSHKQILMAYYRGTEIKKTY